MPWEVLNCLERDTSRFSRHENDNTDLLSRSWNSKHALPSETKGGEMGKPIENHYAVKESSEYNTLKLVFEWIISLVLVYMVSLPVNFARILS